MSSRPILTPTVIGIIGGALSSILYTVTNICLRQVGNVDPVWVSTVKAIPTFFVVLPLVLVQARSGAHFSPRQREFHLRGELSWLVITSIATQIFGNVAFQWALSILGLTISVPIVLATMLIGGALAGRFMLGETVSGRKSVSIVILILATIVLSYSAQNGPTSGETETNSAYLVGAALLANIASGLAYAIQGTIMRRSMQRGLSASSTLLIISATGICFLFCWSFLNVGLETMQATDGSDLTVMIAAGVFNAFAFMAMAKSLQHVSVLYVQLLNASQAAVSALAGWLIFSERLSSLILFGLFLTAIGLIVAGRRDDHAVKLKSEELATS